MTVEVRRFISGRALRGLARLTLLDGKLCWPLLKQKSAWKGQCFPAVTGGPIIRQLQDQRRVIGESGDPLLMGIANDAGASRQLL